MKEVCFFSLELSVMLFMKMEIFAFQLYRSMLAY